jgi:hypothetical protein
VVRKSSALAVLVRSSRNRALLDLPMTGLELGERQLGVGSADVRAL